VEAALQTSADPANAEQADPRAICRGMPGGFAAAARSARVRCATNRH